MSRLLNKSAIITGASQGIGLAIAQSFHQAGAQVILTDIRHDEGQDACDQLGHLAKYHPLDVGDEAQWKALDQWLNDHQIELDVVVNNAGITGLTESSGPHDPENLDLPSWHQVLRTNLDGVALGCKYGIRWLKSRGGSIINISSRSGLVGIPAATAYAASKAGVRNHTKSVALYCAQKSYQIRCNSIHPGAILTPMWDPFIGEGEARKAAVKALAADIPLGEMGKADDVAYGALYLASDESRYVTGIELNIDGGILAGSAASPQQDG